MTIGYEGLDLARFFALLADGRVDTIVDVRQNPISRKPGFSKGALAMAAKERGFNYVHLSVFGCPKSIRDDYKVDGDWSRYTERFMAYLETLDAPLAALVERALSDRCCLLCFESDPDTCHRSFVASRASEIASSPLAVRHLRPIGLATVSGKPQLAATA